DSRFMNASMGFDIASLQPTYELTLGVPGSSFALRIADRLGFPQDLVARATELLEGEGKLSVDQVLARLEDQATDLRKEQRRYEQLRVEAEKAKKRADDRYHELRRQERELLHEESKALKSRLDGAKDVLREYLKSLSQQETVTRKGLDEVRRELQAVEKVVDEVREATHAVAADDTGLVPVPPKDIEEGLSVYVRSFRRAGVADGPARGDDVVVRMGVMRVTVKTSELYYPNDQARRRHASAGTAEPVGVTPVPAIVQTPDNTLDLRGLRVDESIERVELFLDAAYLRGEGAIYVIHGHGTGALKRAVRDWLAGSRYVIQYRRADREEGGDGVTVAYVGDK
ncbi:MAG: Smr/MutS family protein, partial [bacterium]